MLQLKREGSWHFRLYNLLGSNLGLDCSCVLRLVVRKMNCTLITASSDAPCCAGRADEAGAAAPLMERCARLLLYPSCSADICASTASLLQQCQGYCWPLMRFLSSLLTGPDEIHQLLKRAKKGNRRLCYSLSSFLCAHLQRNAI